MARKISIDPTITLATLAGTTRGLSKLTVEEIKALLDGKAPAKAVVVAKPKSEFYEKVIVGGREAREARQKSNHAAAEWMRSKGLVPSGQAWTAVRNEAERDVATLRALNKADGLEVPAKKEAKATKEPKAAKVKAPKAPKAEVEPEPKPKVTVTEQHVAVTEHSIEDQVQALIQGGFTEAEARIVLG